MMTDTIFTTTISSFNNFWVFKSFLFRKIYNDIQVNQVLVPTNHNFGIFFELCPKPGIYAIKKRHLLIVLLQFYVRRIGLFRFNVPTRTHVPFLKGDLQT